MEPFIAQWERRQAIRATLLMVPQAAAACGLTATASTDADGDVSSYYVEYGRRRIRISDHMIPATDRRESDAEFHGRSGTGFRGPEIILFEPRSETWLRRAIILAAAGRSVPGT